MIRAAAFATLLAVRCLAQAPLEFDAAAVKPPNPQGRLLRSVISGGRLTVDNASLRTLIEDAYQILPLQLSGGPGWLDSEKWSITAAGPETATPAQVRWMLQKLLADRFHLKFRVEQREQATYALLVKDTAKAAAQITASEPGQRPTVMSAFANVLSRQLQKMVFDHTGLAGEFDFATENRILSSRPSLR